MIRVITKTNLSVLDEFTVNYFILQLQIKATFLKEIFRLEAVAFVQNVKNVNTRMSVRHLASG